jgi:hypothetical protein
LVQISRISRSELEAAAEVGSPAMRLGMTGLATAALNETAGASKVIGSCRQRPAMVSRNSARSGTLRAIGPCTDCGDQRLLTVPRVTRPGDGRMPTVEQ